MKGIILAGGEGTRLSPLTKVTSKQLLPVYNKPMVLYPLQTLIDAGIKEILIIVAPNRAEDFSRLLGSGEHFGVTITYKVQEKPEGLAQAFILGESFIGEDNVALILGDNIFEYCFREHVAHFKGGAHIFAKHVNDPERFGVVQMDDKGAAIRIIEKPKEKLSDLAITGFYIYDNRVIEAAKTLTPSPRGELEIVDLHNWYLSRGELAVDIIEGAWMDAGTFDSLLEASIWAKNRTLI